MFSMLLNIIGFTMPLKRSPQKMDNPLHLPDASIAKTAEHHLPAHGIPLLWKITLISVLHTSNGRSIKKTNGQWVFLIIRSKRSSLSTLLVLQHSQSRSLIPYLVWLSLYPVRLSINLKPPNGRSSLKL